MLSPPNLKQSQHEPVHVGALEAVGLELKLPQCNTLDNHSYTRFGRSVHMAAAGKSVGVPALGHIAACTSTHLQYYDESGLVNLNV
jgi:hypothetical protein